MYGFYDDLTLLSYVPKKSKVVLLLSTMHNTEATDTTTGKPEIIEFYNKTKGGVDKLDQMCATYTCGRSTRRWPLCIFYCITDIIGVNSYIVYSHFHPEAKESKFRREFIKVLGYSLTENLMIKRLHQKNLPRELRFSIINLTGIETNSIQTDESLAGPSKAPKFPKSMNNTRCAYCPRSANKNCTLRCVECKQLICNNCKVLCCKQCYNENDYLDND